MFSYIRLLLLSTLLALGGCAVANKVVAPYTDLDIQVAKDLNPDISGRPSPAVIRIFELSGRSKFESSDFFQLYESPKANLGQELVAVQDVEVQPGQHLVHRMRLGTKTRFIGVVVAFRDIEKADWRLVIPADPEDYDTLALALDSLTIHKTKG
ncbi:type VI secretion system lipoprotein TssJ [Gallaecimonas kandeliae]|uniref:type VI secretion system lipoprotein TssJ n=1 Tax=Gallaecimonas kandeliae TaxID=3029055 RepID=UPI002647FC56|nr:type VI secretion system lipoprotein TssJ [Gallaecimonas kandeliae]WKE65748.1 type VI secretion system lipoprotein TssJ [Gallaecimonas kandeliae]